MKRGDYVYALVSYYENPKRERFRPEERIVKVGTRERNIVVNNFYLFRDKNGNRVLRMEFHLRDNGGVWATIKDSFENTKVFSFVPLDSLVESSEIVGPN